MDDNEICWLIDKLMKTDQLEIVWNNEALMLKFKRRDSTIEQIWPFYTKDIQHRKQRKNA